MPSRLFDDCPASEGFDRMMRRPQLPPSRRIERDSSLPPRYLCDTADVCYQVLRARLQRPPPSVEQRDSKLSSSDIPCDEIGDEMMWEEQCAPMDSGVGSLQLS
ncbi:MAG: hypothetical protein SGPRY_002995 [Prymnesium sp.]